MMGSRCVYRETNINSEKNKKIICNWPFLYNRESIKRPSHRLENNSGLSKNLGYPDG